MLWAMAEILQLHLFRMDLIGIPAEFEWHA